MQVLKITGLHYDKNKKKITAVLQKMEVEIVSLLILMQIDLNWKTLMEKVSALFS